MTDDDGAAKSPLDVSMASLLDSHSDRQRYGARRTNSSARATRSMSCDLGGLLTAATFALLPSAGES